ncbi:hypothetical protein ACH5RR_027997 [Cinchona calisaya]|uniref:Uncharacterized protein n=1 Tax=Cinchona calisaya TaxID=153742 RepID=A0ABD2YMG1_9GENT
MEIDSQRKATTVSGTDVFFMIVMKEGKLNLNMTGDNATVQSLFLQSKLIISINLYRSYFLFSSTKPTMHHNVSEGLYDPLLLRPAPLLPNYSLPSLSLSPLLTVLIIAWISVSLILHSDHCSFSPV